MQTLLVLLIACVIAGFTACIFVFFVIWRKIHKYLINRKKRQLEQLCKQYLQLQTLLSEMLSYANELDCQTQYLSLAWSNSTKEKYSQTLNGLVNLTDRLTVLKENLELSNLKAIEKELLELIQTTVQLSSNLDAIQLESHIIEKL